jgi:cellulase (glycosyl hydrolase family 5)
MCEKFFGIRTGGLVRRLTAFTAWTVAVGLSLVSTRADDASVQPRIAATGMPVALKTVGNRIMTVSNQPVILRGVNVASLEWTSDGQGQVVKSVTTAIQDWGVNVIRLPLAQDRWFGKGPEQKDDGVAYRALVKEIVDLCARRACYIVLDLHWSDCGEWGTNIAQHSMPDRNSVTFWKDCAAAFKNHPAVIFDLYNEPHDVSWDVWLKGGLITDKPNTRRGGPGRTYEAVGMQELLNTIRATGAKNVVIAGGLDWAYDFSGILEGRQLADPNGHGVIYANHAYNNKGHPVETWIERMEAATARLPVIVSEYGGSGGPHRRLTGRYTSPPGGDDWLLHVMQVLQDRNWNWIAWDFHPSAGPTLIRGWDYEPTADFGVFVKQALAGTLPRYNSPVTEATDGHR